VSLLTYLLTFICLLCDCVAVRVRIDALISVYDAAGSWSILRQLHGLSSNGESHNGSEALISLTIRLAFQKKCRQVSGVPKHATYYIVPVRQSCRRKRVYKSIIVLTCTGLILKISRFPKWISQHRTSFCFTKEISPTSAIWLVNHAVFVRLKSTGEGVWKVTTVRRCRYSGIVITIRPIVYKLAYQRMCFHLKSDFFSFWVAFYPPL